MINMTDWYMKEHGVPDSKWHVLEYVGKSKWKCECECGTIKNVDGNSLRRGGSKSCGKCKKHSNNFIDMAGWNMWEHGVPNSKIIVIKKIPSDKGHAQWECKCNCGNPNTFIVDGSNLRNGHTLSCGCNRTNMNFKNRSNQIINDIYIGEAIGKDKHGCILYDCTCFCGNHFISSATRIINGHTKSCGCLRSKGEKKIRMLLEQNNINFVQEYPLEKVLTEKGHPRRIDFAIFINNKLQYFIEYHGKQHYEKDSNWYRPEADIEKQKYCIKQNIPLIEIPYWHYDNIIIEDLLLNTSQFITNYQIEDGSLGF